MANAYNARKREDERRRRQQQSEQQDTNRSTGSVASPRVTPVVNRPEPLSGLFNTLGLGNRNNTQNNGSTRMGYGALAGNSASQNSTAPLQNRADLMAPVWKSLGIDAKRRDDEKKRRADLEQESSASEAAAYSARRKADQEQDNAYAEASAYSAQRKQEEAVSPRDARRAEREAAQARQDALDGWLEEQETIRRAGMEKEWAREEAQEQADKEADKAIRMNAEQEGSASEAAAYSAARNNAMASQREAAAKASDAQTAQTPEEAARRLADGKYLSFNEAVLAAQDPDVQDAARRAGAPDPARYVKAQQYYTAKEDLEKLRAEYADLQARSNAYAVTRQGDWSEEDQERLIELEGSLIPSLESTVKNFEQDVNYGAEAGSGLLTGLEQAGQYGWQGLNWLFGENSLPWQAANEVATMIGQPFWGEDPLKGKNPITKRTEANERWLEYRRMASQNRTYGNDLGRAIAAHADSIGASAPFIVINLMSLPAAGLAATGSAATAGLNYTSALAQSSGLQSFRLMATHGLEAFASNPAAQYSMATTFGPSYDDALKEGASPAEATLYATVNSLYNAMVEVGGADEAAGGMEALPKQITDAMENGKGFKEAAMDYVKSIAGEVGEEELQRIFENGLKQIYTDVPVYSNNDPSAIINIGDMLETAKNTALETAIMGGAQTAGQYAYQGASNIVNGGPTAINQQEAVRAAAREAGINLSDQQIADIASMLDKGTQLDVAISDVLGVDLSRNNGSPAETSARNTRGEERAEAREAEAAARRDAAAEEPAPAEAPTRPSGAGENVTVPDGGDRTQGRTVQGAPQAEGGQTTTPRNTRGEERAEAREQADQRRRDASQETSQNAPEPQEAQVDESVPADTQKSTEGDSEVFNGDAEREEVTTERKGGQISTEETLNQLGLGSDRETESEHAEQGLAEESDEEVARGPELPADLRAVAESLSTYDFEQDNTNKSRFQDGQGNYGAYSPEARKDILNYLYPDEHYYVSVGQVVRERTPTTVTGQSTQRGDMRTGSNHARPKPRRNTKQSTVPPPSPPKSTGLSASDVKPGLRIKHTIYGEGTVTTVEKGMATVKFADGAEKKFTPDGLATHASPSRTNTNATLDELGLGSNRTTDKSDQILQTGEQADAMEKKGSTSEEDQAADQGKEREDGDLPFYFGSEERAAEAEGNETTAEKSKDSSERWPSAEERKEGEQLLGEMQEERELLEQYEESRRKLEELGYQFPEGEASKPANEAQTSTPDSPGVQRLADAADQGSVYDADTDLGEGMSDALNETASRLLSFYEENLTDVKVDRSSGEVEKVSKLKTDYVQAIKAVTNAMESMTKGEATPEQLFAAYEALGDKKTLHDGYFHDENVQKAIDACREAAKQYALLPEEKNKAAYQEAFQTALHRMEFSLADRMENLTVRIAMNDELRRNGRSNRGGKGKRLGRTYLKSMLRPDVMIKDWGGADRKASRETYTLAEQHNQSIIRKINVFMEAHKFFDAVMKNPKVRDFANGKTRCDITGWSDNLSLNVLKLLEDPDGIAHILEGGLYVPMNETNYYKRKGDNSELGSNAHAFRQIDFVKRRLEVAEENLRERGNYKKGEGPSWTQIQEEATRIAKADLEELRRKLHDYFSDRGIGGQFYAASKEMVAYAAKEINQVSQKVIGEDVARGGNDYWSLMICGHGGSLSSEALAPTALEDRSIFQQRSGPSGGLRAIPFTEAANRYITQFSDYVAFRELSHKLELLDTACYAGGRNANTDTLSSTVGKMDQYNAKWLKDYVADLNNQRGAKGDVMNSALRTLRGNLAQSALLINPGVALKQTPSYFGYAGEIPMKYLARHAYGMLMPASYFSKNKTVQGVNGATNMLRSRQSGYNIIEMGEAMDSNRGLFRQVLGRMTSGMNWINMMDYRTVANGLMATADWVADTTKLKPGTEAFYDEVAKRFERATLLTNPIYTSQARSAIQRSTNEVVRSLSMFKTQPFQYANQLYLAAREYDAAMKSSDYSKGEKAAASKKLSATVAGVVTANALFSLIGTAMKMALHKKKKFTDEDGEVNWYKVAQSAGMEFLESMAGIAWFGDYASAIMIDTAFGVANKATGGQIEKTSEFYGISENTTGLVNDAIEAMMNVTTNPSLKNAKAAATSLVSALGIPLGNAYNIMNTVFMYSMDLSGNNPRDVDDAVALASQYFGKSDEEKAKYTVEHAMELMRHNRTEAATALMVSLGEKGFEKQIANAISKAYAEGKIEDVIALNWMKTYAGKSDEDAEKVLGKAKVDYEYGKIKDDFEKGLDVDSVFESLGITVPKKERDAATEELEKYLKDEKKREIAEDLGVEYTSDFDKVSGLDDPLAFLGIKKAYLTAEKNKDWDTIDDLIKGKGPYAKLSDEAKEMLDDSAHYANEVFDAATYGISAKEWYWAHEKYKEIRDGDGNATDKAEAFKTWLSHTAFTTAQKNLLVEQMGYQTVLTAETKSYDNLVDAGLSNEMAQYYSGLKRGNDADNEAEILSTIVNGKGSKTEKETALSVYLTEGQYKRYQRALDAGVGPKNWAKFLEAAKQAHVERTGGTSGSLSKADIEAACEAMGWKTSADKKQMWAVYKGS